MQSAPGSATHTSIATSVRSGGKYPVTSPYLRQQEGMSSTDFFTPPLSPSTAADVVSGRMARGENRTVTIGTANKIGVMLFGGTLGRR